MSQPNPCIFCDIIAGKSSETTIEFENDNIVIFKDIRPASDNHYLAVTKHHMEDVRTLAVDQKDLILDMQNQLRDLMQSKGVDLNDVSYGFHYPPFVSVKHLHMHGIGPISKMGLISRIIFARTNMWYCSPEYIISKLKPGE